MAIPLLAILGSIGSALASGAGAVGGALGSAAGAVGSGVGALAQAAGTIGSGVAGGGLMSSLGGSAALGGAGSGVGSALAAAAPSLASQIAPAAASLAGGGGGGAPGGGGGSLMEMAKDPNKLHQALKPGKAWTPTPEAPRAAIRAPDAPPSLTQPMVLEAPPEVSGFEGPSGPAPKQGGGLMSILNKAYLGPDADSLSREDKIAAYLRGIGAAGRGINASGGNIGAGLQQGFNAARGYTDDVRSLEDRDRTIARQGRYDEYLEARTDATRAKAAREELEQDPPEERVIDVPGGKKQRQVWSAAEGIWKNEGEPTDRWKPREANERAKSLTASQRDTVNTIMAEREWYRALDAPARERAVRLQPDRVDRALKSYPGESDKSYRAWRNEIEARARPAPEPAPDPAGPGLLDRLGSFIDETWNGTAPEPSDAMRRLEEKYPTP